MKKLLKLVKSLLLKKINKWKKRNTYYGIVGLDGKSWTQMKLENNSTKNI